MEVVHINQLAARWCISEATLERWRYEEIGQASAGTPNNTREPARSGKKNPNREWLGFGYWWCWGDATRPITAAMGSDEHRSAMILR